MNRKRNSKLPRRQSGFLLLETLVAILVLSFGLLGMVGIQAYTLKANTDAKQQSTAVQMAGELADMMRGNRGVSLKTTANANPYLFNGLAESPPVASENCTNQTCTTALTVAQWEMNDWVSRINQAYPGANVQVCFDTAPYNSAGLPQWGCAGAANGWSPISIKIGWIRATTNDDRATGSANAFNTATSVPPAVVYTVTPGVPI